jgi:DNA modification methylase
MTWESRIIGHGEMDPHELIPNPKNWRTHPKLQEKALEGALEDIGWIQDVIVNERTGKLLDGHLRVELAKKRGEHKIPVVMVDLSEEEEELALITLDPITAMAEADKDMLNDLIERCKTDNQKVKDLLQNIAEKEKLPIGKKVAEEDDYEPPAEIETDIVRGDIIQLGRHRVMCGDSTSREDVERLMNGKKADMVFTDPPYAAFGSSTGLAENIVDDKMIRPFFKEILSSIRKNTKPFRHIYLCCDWRSYSTFWEINRDVGLAPKNLIVWHKPNARLGSMYSNSHEFLFFLSNKYKERMTQSVGKERTVYGETNVWVYSIDTNKKRLHNAEKPIVLLERSINNSSDENELILDPFLGSGTTLIACEQLDRICYGMEISPQYCEVICQRWEKLTGEERLKINGVDATT